MAKDLIVYEWNAWNNFLISRVAPDAIHIRARVGPSAGRVMAAVPAAARLFLFHLDCTYTARFPLDRAALTLQLHQRGLRVLNEHMLDISKRHLQRTCALAGLNSTATGREGAPDDLVIVKTNLNAGGVRERRLPIWYRWWCGFRFNRTIRTSNDYKVLRRADVPVGCWDDDTAVVERYISNQDGTWFRAFLLLDRLAVSRARSTRQIKRMYDGSERTNTCFTIRGDTMVSLDQAHPIPAPVLDAIVGIVRAMRMEFGSLDLTCDDQGRAYVVDVNVTPFWRDDSDAIIGHLRGALEDRR